MAEYSDFWPSSTPAIGDGPTAATKHVMERFRAIFERTLIRTPASQSVVQGYGNELAVTMSGTNVQIATGAAIVKGYVFENDSVRSIASRTGVTATDMLVLEANKTAQTVRLKIVQGTTTPQQDANFTTNAAGIWQVPLANISVNGGTVTIASDRRSFVQMNGDLIPILSELLSWSNSKISVVNNAVSTAKLADLSVATAKLAALQVTTPKIPDLNVTAAKLGAGGIANSNFQDYSILGSKIADLTLSGAVFADKSFGSVPNNEVATAKIADGQVTGAKIPNNTIIAETELLAGKLADNGISIDSFANGAIISSKFAPGSVDISKIAMSPFTAKVLRGPTSGYYMGVLCGYWSVPYGNKQTTITFPRSFATTPALIYRPLHWTEGVNAYGQRTLVPYWTAGIPHNRSGIFWPLGDYPSNQLQRIASRDGSGITFYRDYDYVATGGWTFDGQFTSGVTAYDPGVGYNVSNINFAFVAIGPVNQWW